MMYGNQPAQVSPDRAQDAASWEAPSRLPFGKSLSAPSARIKGFLAVSGVAFFRQLPAGVPGAYRLLANLLALAQPRVESEDIEEMP